MTTQRMRHLTRVLALAAVLLLAGLGVGYAAWQETLTVNGSIDTATMHVRWRVNGEDPFGGNSLACNQTAGPATLPDPIIARDGTDDQLLHVSVAGVAPGYAATCTMETVNDGEVPVHGLAMLIEGQNATNPNGTPFDLDGDGQADLLIAYHNGGGTLDPGEVHVETLKILVLQTAQPGAHLEFTGTHTFAVGP